MPTLVPIVGTGGQATFELGGDRPGKPSRLVSIADFRLSDTHITRAEWRQVRSASPGYTLALGGAVNPPQEPNTLPAVLISWFDACAWCNALSEFEALTPRYLSGGSRYLGGATAAVALGPGDGYRLVTSREWEYAAREGNAGPGGNARPGSEWSGAHGALKVVDVANVEETYPWDPGPSDGPEIWGVRGPPVLLPAGSLNPNALGLSDMSGNVQEWTHTPGSGAHDYDNDASEPVHPWYDRQRIIRGGAYAGPSANLRPNERAVLERSGRLTTLGTRVAMDGLS